MKETPGQLFRTELQMGPLACIGAYDPVTARIAEEAGARIVYVSGYAAAAVATGYPDLGLISQTEMATHIQRICNATSRPVIADADTGYGGILNARRTVQLWESAGAAGLHFEDQVFPKRCGHITGKAVIPVQEMVSKLRAAIGAKSSPDFFIIARTDALAVNGLNDAIDRCKAYAAAGADALFVDAPESVEQLKVIARELKPLGKPLVFNSARTGKSPTLNEKVLNGIGFDIVFYPIEALLASHQAVKHALNSIVNSGGTEEHSPAFSTFKELNELVHLNEFVNVEAKFSEVRQ